MADTNGHVRGLRLFTLLLVTGVLVTFVHDYAYRRVDKGLGQYEFGGLISHAGTDMLITTIIVSVAALVYTRSRSR